jgi:hypothetical protein
VILLHHLHLPNSFLLLALPTTEVEDLLITFVQRPVKVEPIIYDDTYLNPPQLDGQTDFPFADNRKQKKRKNKNEKSIKIEPSEFHIIPQQLNTFQINSNNKKKSRNRSRRKMYRSRRKINRSSNKQNQSINENNHPGKFQDPIPSTK